MKAIDVEIAVVNHFNPRANLIVPNVHWGMFIHECDLLMLSKAGYATEIEIKVSKSDLIADKKKKHGHKDERIKHLYFAIPKSLEAHTEHIPERSGIIIVSEKEWWGMEGGIRLKKTYLACDIIRSPQTQSKYKFSDRERYELARLGALRIWGLKKKLSVPTP